MNSIRRILAALAGILLALAAAPAAFAARGSPESVDTSIGLILLWPRFFVAAM